MKLRHVASTLLATLIAVLAFAQAPTGEAPRPAAPSESADGVYSAARLYNLANSYARAGRPGLAVLNYERAALLAPNDADIQANLQFVRSSAHVANPAGGRLDSAARWASPVAVALIGVLGVVIAGLSLLAGGVYPRRRTLWIGGTTLGFAAIAFVICNGVYWEPKIHEAVVIAATTPIRSTPVPMGDPLQQLSEAETVTITAAHEDFVLVRTRSGRSGWAARADLADVVPKAAPR